MDVILFSLRDVLMAGFSLLTWAIIIRAILSWFGPDPSHPLIRLLLKVTDPILDPISRRMPDLGGLDISPIVAIFGLQFAQGIVGALLTRLAGG
ncbi:MAG: hypothetical protein A2508_08365 [Candidatus Lambdaproteobacteria bacterium RIFOXYD12_FULL_49_8]|uniref:YggT family protein n=1 Tax=Candidatus Lambdaproteobacteria bacterium RIFOXYD2_FULL_50_16 TaxID=1817772 RepID=A0A1F6G601_9PROT|nr:MAG: hypothetical protein A2527_11540 [Candidatus Lambdaproteobacteria bacterium RIFOXYD2_FULL_50_16]OGG98032.1 MAG: hypothetical protein A2508_08365 [Candidatus Lambdaproteobacteria bacterium RIFOXYD12_FULL_49_8]